MIRGVALSAVAVSLFVGCSDPQPDVIFETDLGNITIEVNPAAAPLSAADFLSYVDQGLYDGQGFYRTVTPENDPLSMGMSLVQGGRLNVEPIRPPVPHEPTSQTGLSNIPGSVALARNEVGSGSAAFFFVNLGDNSFLDAGEDGRNPDGAGYAVFGRVTKGMDTLRAIQAREVAPDPLGIFSDGQKLAEPVYILRAYRD